MEKKIKTIAIFMGLFQDDKGFWGFKNTPERQRCHSDRIKDIYQYDIDWNWLMKVVEKIESVKDSYHGRFGVYISSNSCTIQSTNFRSDKPIANPSYYYDDVIFNSKLESTYNAVVRFINFYNKQKEE